MSGIQRHIDELGRIVLPKEWRSALNIKERDMLDIKLVGNKLTITKARKPKTCTNCNGKGEL